MFSLGWISYVLTNHKKHVSVWFLLTKSIKGWEWQINKSVTRYLTYVRHHPLTEISYIVRLQAHHVSIFIKMKLASSQTWEGLPLIFFKSWLFWSTAVSVYAWCQYYQDSVGGPIYKTCLGEVLLARILKYSIEYHCVDGF